MRQQIEKYLDYLYSIDVFDEEVEYSTFKGVIAEWCGKVSVTQCTSSAMLIARQFNGTVYGYELTDRSLTENLAYWSHGHDFAVVENYIVDYWAKHVHHDDNKSILDMNDPEDQKIIAIKYLPLEKWEALPAWNFIQG